MPAGWPIDKKFVVEVAQSLHVGLEHYSGGGPLSDREDEFRALLVGRGLRAFHCTRLLDYEIENVREHGLRLLTEDLVRGRIQEAARRDDIPSKLADELLRGHVFVQLTNTTIERTRCASSYPPTCCESELVQSGT